MTELFKSRFEFILFSSYPRCENRIDQCVEVPQLNWQILKLFLVHDFPRNDQPLSRGPMRDS